MNISAFKLTNIVTDTKSIPSEKVDCITDQWGFYRQVYMEKYSDIMNMAEKNINTWEGDYYFNWSNHFSPIEFIAWHSIRDMNNLILYPQFPVFNYFIDFANPYLKIGVELDGKEFHNIEKDTERDLKLQKFGWKIFRISGKEAYHKYKTDSELVENGIVGIEKYKEIENWILNTCDGVLTAIKYWYFTSDEEKKSGNFNFFIDCDKDEEIIDFYSLAKLTLENHNLVNINLNSINKRNRF